MRMAVMTVLLRLNWSQTRGGAVVIFDGVVHLWGMMASSAQRSAFVDAVRSVPGVKSVKNHMHVGQPTARPSR
jgi:osmotically-inducible protein OsmY